MTVRVFGAWDLQADDVQRPNFGILSSVLHGLVMIPQSFLYPNEHAHLWSGVPFIFAMAAVLWVWHPSRIRK